MTYSWHRHGDSVPSRSRGQNSNTLTIPTATPPDEGIYYCMARKERISVESSRARLRVDGEKSMINYKCVLLYSTAIYLIPTINNAVSLLKNQ